MEEYAKYPNLVPKEETPEVPEVDPKDAEIERLHAEARERDMASAANDARLEMMERQLAQGYNDRSAAQTAPSVSPSYEAQQELGITDDDLIAHPAENMRKIAEQVGTRLNAESMQRVGAVVGNLANSTYEMELKELSKHPYYASLEGSLRQHFRNVPQEYTNSPGSIKKKFNELIGENLTELQRLEVESGAEAANSEAQISGATNAAPATRSPRARAVEPSINVASPTPRSPGPTKGGKVVLDDARQDVMDTFNAFMSPEDRLTPEGWLEIEEGRALPKKVSADIQVGIAKANVEY